MRPVLTILIASLPLATPAFAQDREEIGKGRLFTNDFFGGDPAGHTQNGCSGSSGTFVQ